MLSLNLPQTVEPRIPDRARVGDHYHEPLCQEARSQKGWWVPEIFACARADLGLFQGDDGGVGQQSSAKPLHQFDARAQVMGCTV